MIEFWVNFSSVPAPGAFVAFIGHDEGGGTTNKRFLNVDNGRGGPYVQDLGFFYGNGSRFVSTAVPFAPTTGQWYLIDLSKSGSDYQFYVDGQLIGSVIETLAIPDVNAPLTIGQAEGAGYFDGKLDGVAIYHRALSQAEVQQTFLSGQEDALDRVRKVAPDGIANGCCRAIRNGQRESRHLPISTPRSSGGPRSSPKEKAQADGVVPCGDKFRPRESGNRDLMARLPHGACARFADLKLAGRTYSGVVQHSFVKRS